MHATAAAAPLVAPVPKPEPGNQRLLRFSFSRIGLAAACLLLTGLLGYLDYLTGYEQSLLLFYLVPIALATWFGGLIFGLIFSVLSVAVWVVSDLVAGIPTVGAWNLVMALAAYVVFAVLLSKLRAVLGDLENR